MARPFLSFQTLFCAFSLVVPSVMVLAPKGVVPVLVAMALATLLVWRLEGRQLQRPAWWALLPLALLLLWATAASLWTFQPGQALVLSVRLGVVLVAGLWLLACAQALARDESRRVARFLAVGFGLAVVILALETLLGHPFGELLRALGLGPAIAPHRFNRGATYLAILVWPLTAAVWTWLGPRALLIPAALLLLFLPLESLSAITSLVAALAFLPLAFFRLRVARLLLSGGAVVAVLAAPLLTFGIDRASVRDLDLLSANAQHRLHIWSFAGERIAEAPIFGWGFNASRAIPSGDTERFKSDQRTVIPLHPHNAGLQVWLELGLVGAGLLAGLILAVLLALSRTGRIDQILGLAMFLAAFWVASVSYGLWQNQWVAALLTSAVVFQLCRPGDEPELRARRPEAVGH